MTAAECGLPAVQDGRLATSPAARAVTLAAAPVLPSGPGSPAGTGAGSARPGGCPDGGDPYNDALIQAKVDAAESYIANFYNGTWPPAAPVPNALLEAIKLLAAHLYENREASLVGVTSQELPLGLFDLLGPYRAWAF